MCAVCGHCPGTACGEGGALLLIFSGSLEMGHRTTPSGLATRAAASGVLLTTQKLVSAACLPVSATSVRPIVAAVVTAADEPLAARARKSACESPS